MPLVCNYLGNYIRRQLHAMHVRQVVAVLVWAQPVRGSWFDPQQILPLAVVSLNKELSSHCCVADPARCINWGPGGDVRQRLAM